MELTPPNSTTVQVLTSTREVQLPFTVTLMDFEVARAAYMERLDQACIDDPESLALTMAMVEHARKVWQVILTDDHLFLQFATGQVLDEDSHFKGAVLTAAGRLGEDVRQFFAANENDWFWDRYELFRDLIVSNRLCLPGADGDANGAG